ncbi:MAG TPA: hypothetical protein VMD28_04030, partial [Acidimicrobiales bacterium]|nr:hypothetical protein [Acidimicrobiales bacterium]
MGSDCDERGTLIGRDLLGGPFAYDPFELYARGVLSNPTLVVFGLIGRGKSAFVKTYLWRQAVFGRRAWVVDPKGEYGTLARHWGVRPVALRPDGPVRLNPLDATDRDASQVDLLATLAAASLRRDVLPRERTALELALTAARSETRLVTLPLVVQRMLDPMPGVEQRVHTDRAALVEDGRDVALELRRLVHGDLRGMFDGPTTPGLDLSGPLVVLDLSALYNSAALGLLMLCATAWLQAAATAAPQGAPSGSRMLLVVDEAWAILNQLPVARWLQSSWKLSRARGVSNVAVLHRLSDLSAVGVEGSEEVSLARGILADSETRVIYAQPPGEAGRAAELLSLSSTECELLPQLRRGVALWKLGERS